MSDNNRVQAIDRAVGKLQMEVMEQRELIVSLRLQVAELRGERDALKSGLQEVEDCMSQIPEGLPEGLFPPIER